MKNTEIKIVIAAANENEATTTYKVEQMQMAFDQFKLYVAQGKNVKMFTD